jgi:hypothetical protein
VGSKKKLSFVLVGSGDGGGGSETSHPHSFGIISSLFACDRLLLQRPGQSLVHRLAHLDHPTALCVPLELSFPTARLKEEEHF